MLTLPDETWNFMIYSDLSHKGLGCVLMQYGKGDSICFKTTYGLQVEIPCPWPRVRYYSICLKDLVTLLVW